MSSANESGDLEPVWWTVQHTLVWEQHLPALRADFEQRTAARSRERAARLGPDDPVLQQHAVTPRNVDVEHAYSVPDQDWEVRTTWKQIEPAVRYGVGARSQYPRYESWVLELEVLLRKDWEQTYPPHTWEKVKRAVRHGFEAARKNLI